MKIIYLNAMKILKKTLLKSPKNRQSEQYINYNLFLLILEQKPGHILDNFYQLAIVLNGQKVTFIVFNCL